MANELYRKSILFCIVSNPSSPSQRERHVKTICLDPVNYVTSHFEGIQVFTTLGYLLQLLISYQKNGNSTHNVRILVEAVAEVTTDLFVNLR